MSSHSFFNFTCGIKKLARTGVDSHKNGLRLYFDGYCNLLLFRPFSSVGNLKPKLKPFFKLIFKLKMFLLNRAPAERDPGERPPVGDDQLRRRGRDDHGYKCQSSHQASVSSFE